MIYCLLDPELFDDSKEASMALKQHYAILKESRDAVVLGNRSYNELLRKRINDPGIRNFYFKTLNNTGRYRVVESFYELPIQIQNLEKLICILPEEERGGIVELIRCMLVDIARQTENDEIVVASWWKPDLVTRDGNKNITAKNVWRLLIEIDKKPVSVFNVCSERNWRIRWTTRYADELPDIDDENIGDFPFCFPDEWQDLEEVRATKNSRTGWKDFYGNVWAESSSGPHGQKHWDVQLEAIFSKKYGRSHLNVNKWGSDKDPGTINHKLPKSKSGWKRDCTSRKKKDRPE